MEQKIAKAKLALLLSTPYQVAKHTAVAKGTLEVRHPDPSPARLQHARSLCPLDQEAGPRIAREDVERLRGRAPRAMLDHPECRRSFTVTSGCDTELIFGAHTHNETHIDPHLSNRLTSALSSTRPTSFGACQRVATCMSRPNVQSRFASTMSRARRGRRPLRVTSLCKELFMGVTTHQ